MTHTGIVHAYEQFGDKVVGESFENAEIFAAGVVLFEGCYFKECIIHDDPVITYMRCWLDNVRANTFAFSRAGNLSPLRPYEDSNACPIEPVGLEYEGWGVMDGRFIGSDPRPAERVCQNSTCGKTTASDKPCWWCGEK